MAKDIARPSTGKQVTQFDPERHRLKVAALNYSIEEAKRIKAWPQLEEAVDDKIEEQQAFVGWWKLNVSSGESRRANRVPGSLPLAAAEKQTGMRQQRVSDLGKRLAKPDQYREHLLGAGYRAAMLEVVDNLRGTQGTGENEWFTPDKYLDLTREVLGTIELDPASSDKAQKVVRATTYFTKADDGLKQEWRGKIWLNPPYAQPFIAQFISKLVAEHAAGRAIEAILLTHNYTDTAWFHEAASRAAAICFTRGRIRFYEPDVGIAAAPTQGQAFCYFGPNVDVFAAAFGGIGFIVTPYVWS